MVLHHSHIPKGHNAVLPMLPNFTTEEYVQIYCTTVLSWLRHGILSKQLHTSLSFLFVCLTGILEHVLTKLSKRSETLRDHGNLMKLLV